MSLIRNLILLLLIFGACTSNTEKIDILILNGTLFDGSGNESYPGDIGIVNDTIFFIGDSKERNFQADYVIEAAGLVVSPGFMDPHTHALGDLSSSERNSNINYLTQGVTTVFVGNDGDGPFEIEKKALQLEQNGMGTNVALFVGHKPVRKAVLGDEDVAPTTKQLEEMRMLVRKGMQEGAFGFSTGLYYAPGSYAETEEVIELTKEIADFDGVYDSHIRDESSYNIGLIAAVKEALEIGKSANVRVNLAHIKALGVDVWNKSDEVIALVEEALSNGQKVSADQYPWQASGTHIENALIDRWVMNGGDEKYYSRLNDPELIPRIKREMEENLRKRGGPSSILITADCKDTTMIGYNLGQLSERLNEDPVDVALKIARMGGARIASFNMNSYDVENFMKQSWVMTSSDGTKGHPRKYASFPKKYEEYVVNKQLLTMESFIYKSSGLVAETFGVKKRGSISVGNFADIIIWDPNEYKALANFSKPEELTIGMQYVLVNGKIAIDKGEYTGKLSGSVLRK